MSGKFIPAPVLGSFLPSLDFEVHVATSSPVDDTGNAAGHSFG